ncbi:ABC transporter ATP-binding protein [Dyella silvatica]|uniref:ABC transporter ATP-binding protein n=1 Tax=Dyella silvatica TaxID=2992128 RepID=UPI00225357CD|nr:ABC transporter ATP-binding protein [Dyella silvatica]
MSSEIKVFTSDTQSAESAASLNSDVVICVRDVSKVYHVYEKPADRLKQSLYPRVQKFFGQAVKQYHHEFWALKGVSFEIKRGEAVGIVGRNGSGKSTLLQLICGTLSPTAGSVEVNGRIAALLELGAGFNPEFTGRENVYMSATILGLSREEIDSCYEDIIAFADIGDFINQPVKVYSSGMYVRLAFAVIAHVNADILVIDEALAVGDAVFVQKCMRFLRSFRERGTLLFVSHDSSAVINFCQSAIWLDHGVSRMKGSAQEVANAYLEYCAQEIYGDTVKIRALKQRRLGEDSQVEAMSTEAEASRVDKDVKVVLFDNIAHSDGWKSDSAYIESVTLSDLKGEPVTVFAGGEKVRLTIVAKTLQAVSSPILGFFVKDRLGQSLFGEHTYTHVQPALSTQAGDILEASFKFTLPLLPDGEYSMTVSVAEGDPWDNIQHHWLHDAVLIRVSSTKLRYGLVGIPFDDVKMHVVPSVDERRE